MLQAPGACMSCDPADANADVGMKQRYILHVCFVMMPPLS